MTIGGPCPATCSSKGRKTLFLILPAAKAYFCHLVDKLINESATPLEAQSWPPTCVRKQFQAVHTLYRRVYVACLAQVDDAGRGWVESRRLSCLPLHIRLFLPGVAEVEQPFDTLAEIKAG